jgi:hypothetical protein
MIDRPRLLVVLGLVFLLLALTGLCTLIQVYSPACIKKSITVGQFSAPRFTCSGGSGI